MRYSAYLLQRRGLARSTVRNYVGVARVFLAWRERTVGGLELDRLDAAAVSEFVLAESQRSCVGSAKCMVTRLRVLLRFLHVEGEIEYPLADAVPSVAGWRLAGLVKALDAGRFSGCRGAAIGAPALGAETSRSSPCSRGSGCAPARSPRSRSRMSIGAAASCWSMARAAGMTCCHCLAISATRWSRTCAVVQRATPGRCS